MSALYPDDFHSTVFAFLGYHAAAMKVLTVHLAEAEKKIAALEAAFEKQQGD